MRRMAVLGVAGLLGALLLAPTTAEADLVDKETICHRYALGHGLEGSEWNLLEVAAVGVNPHLAHGDGLPGGEVPDFRGYEFDSNCVPQVAEVSYAVAYVNADGAPGFQPDANAPEAGDQLIAKLVEANGDDGPGVGDKVILGRYPTDLLAASFGDWAVDEYLVTRFEASAFVPFGGFCEAWVSDGMFFYFSVGPWGDSGAFENLEEYSFGSSADFLDGVGPGTFDSIFVEEGGPTTVSPIDLREDDRIADDPFFDVDLNCVPAGP